MSFCSWRIGENMRCVAGAMKWREGASQKIVKLQWDFYSLKSSMTIYFHKIFHYFHLLFQRIFPLHLSCICTSTPSPQSSNYSMYMLRVVEFCLRCSPHLLGPSTQSILHSVKTRLAVDLSKCCVLHQSLRSLGISKSVMISKELILD